MPLYMDRHEVPGASAEDVANAHVSDLATSPKFGVKFLSYWFDSEEGRVFCFADAPSRDALADLHSESHGLIPNEIIDVSQDDVFRFLGRVHDPKNVSEITSPLRTVMFTDLVRSTEILGEVGETEFINVISAHDGVVREALYRNRGSEVKHTGDGIMASFEDADDAVHAAVSIVEAFRDLEPVNGVKLEVRVGLASGQPVDRDDDLYGQAVVLASRLTDAAAPQQIVAAASVFAHADHHEDFDGPYERRVKGFADPVDVYEVRSGQVSSHVETLEASTPRASWWQRLTGRS